MRYPALVALAAVYGCLVILQAACTPLAMYDEPLWYRRSRIPVWERSERGYVLAVDLPGMNRLVYGAALDLFGLDDLPNKEPDYKAKPWENFRDGCFAPADAVMAMRGCNVIAYLIGLAALYYAAWLALRRHGLALLAVSPVCLSWLYIGHIVPRVGPDALLFQWLAIFLAVWLYLHLRGPRDLDPRYSLLLGAIAGLATFAKQNGALVLLAYMGYLAFACRGRWRLLCPTLAGAGAFLVFYFFNFGVVWHWPQTVAMDILARRAVAATALETYSGPCGFFELAQKSMPLWPLLPVAGLALWRCRREPWFAPVAWWAGALAAGTIMMINLPLARYIGPVELGWLYVFALAAIAPVRAFRRERRGRKRGLRGLTERGNPLY